jgi:hypothetical protein
MFVEIFLLRMGVVMLFLVWMVAGVVDGFGAMVLGEERFT